MLGDGAGRAYQVVAALGHQTDGIGFVVEAVERRRAVELEVGLGHRRHRFGQLRDGERHLETTGTVFQSQALQAAEIDVHELGREREVLGQQAVRAGRRWRIGIERFVVGETRRLR